GSYPQPEFIPSSGRDQQGTAVSLRAGCANRFWEWLVVFSPLPPKGERGDNKKPVIPASWARSAPSPGRGSKKTSAGPGAAPLGGSRASNRPGAPWGRACGRKGGSRRRRSAASRETAGRRRRG